MGTTPRRENTIVGATGNKADVKDLSNSDALVVAVVDGSGDQITAFGGSGGTSAADDADFTATSTSGTPTMGVREDSPTTVTDGDLGVVGITASRELKVDITSNSAGVGGGVSYTEDAAAAANPVGPVQILVRDDAPGAQVTTDGDNVARRGTNYGAAYTQVVTSAGAFVDSFGGGTQYTEADTDATIVGTALMLEDAANTLRAATGDVTNGLDVDVTRVGGTVTVDGSGVTQPVSGTVAVTGVATAANQLADGHNVTVDNSTGAAAVNIQDGGNVITVDGTVAVTGVALAANQLADGHNVTVDNASIAVTAAALPLPSGAATAAAQLADGHNVTIDNASVVVDLGSNNDVTVEGGAVLGTDGAAGPANALSVGGTQSDGTFEEVRVDTDGHLQVDIVADGAGLLTTTAHDAAFGTAGSADAQVRTVQGVASMTPLLTDASATTQPVSGTVTETNSGTIAGDTTSIDTKMVSGTVIGAVEITDTSFAVADGNALGEGVLVQGDDGTDRKNIAVDATSGNVQVDIATALPAGTAAIGKLAANTGVDIGDVDILSIAAGDNNIGNVDIVSGTVTTVSTVTAITSVDKAIYVDDADFTADTSSVMLGGAVADAVIVDANTTAGDVAPLSVNDQGALWVSPAHVDSTDDVIRDDDLDENAAVISANAGVMYGITATNLDATPVFIHLYNIAAAGVTVGTSVGELTICVPSQGDANGAAGVFTFPVPLYFDTAASWAATTTVGGNTGPGTNEVFVNCFYRDI